MGCGAKHAQVALNVKANPRTLTNEGAKYERAHQQSVLQQIGGWVGGGVVGARVVAISTSGMPFARTSVTTMFVDYGGLSLALTTLLA